MGEVHRQKFETLSGQNADSFEAEYVRAQVEAHDEAVSLYHDFVADATAGELRAFAQETLPVLQQHRERIYEIAGSMGLEVQQRGQAEVSDSQQAQSGQLAAEDQAAMSGTCQTSLANFANEIGEDQFWVTGWGNRWGTGQVDPATTTTDTMPWAGAGTDLRSPRAQIRELYGAAQVLAYQGNSEGCQYLLDVLDNTYQSYTARLNDAGIAPDNVSGWRQEQLALAQPVTDLSEMGRLNADDITGTDVRNLKDENLGSVSDLVLDPASGQLTYVVVARGGFLGIGEDYLAVPWDRFSATPGLNTLVLNMDVETLQNASAIDPDTFGDPNTYSQQDQQIGEFWNM
jgi:sporulation protein YlmC with PRC-barrel domain